jgi:hypothetical protein
MTYKISLRINMYIKYFYIKELLRKYANIIEHSAICIITTPDNNKIRYIDIYVKHLINVEDFFKFCLDLDTVRYSINDNIKLKHTGTNTIIYSLKQEYKTVKRTGKISRRYDKVNV